jgi:hypothetical protein
MRRIFAATMFALLAACASKSAVPSAAAFSFALLGDAPYRASDEGRFAAMLQQINDDPSVRFVLHVGDLKGSSESCADALLRRRLAQFSLVQTALIYTPGDNEWTDCHRPAAGRFNPLERLAALRRFAFAQPDRSFGQRPLTLQSQSAAGTYREFVENTMFTQGGVLFVTLHVVGSNNDLDPWQGIDRNDRTDTPRADRIAEFERRQSANLAWLNAAFARAKAADAVAIVIAMQANPRFERPAGSPLRTGFDRLLEALRRLTQDFGRPVLLAHGDGHVSLVDRPWARQSPAIGNLLRVQTYGHPWTLWVRISVDPEYEGIFEVRPGDPPRIDQ